MIKETNVTINVSDMDKSVSFYESIGLTLKKRWENYYAQFNAPGIVIGLHPTDSKNLKGNSGNISIGFTADNFDEAELLLNKLKIAVTKRQEDGGHFLHFHDPDGSALYFIKPRG